MTHLLMHHKLPRDITFDPIVGLFSSIPFQKLKIKTYPKAATSIFTPKAINRPRHAPDGGGHIFSENFPSSQPLSTFFLSSKHQKTLKKIHQNLLILLSSPRTHGIAFLPILPFLGSTLWIWGLGVWIQIFSYHPHL